MQTNSDLDKELRKAIKHFWSTRKKQSKRQGALSGSRDAGARTAVTGGRQMDGFVNLVKTQLASHGVPSAHVFCRQRVELPGWYRPEKKWDLLIVANKELVAAIEFKSQVGSFGNNYNNRTEEAIGSATDIWAAYREGAFKPSSRPWLGYMMLLEDAPRSMRPVKAQEPHFEVFPEFKSASYAKRYEVLLTKMIRERLYDAACFLVSNATEGLNGEYREPSAELAFEKFISSLLGRTSTTSRS